jgi:hypothetical protein
VRFWVCGCVFQGLVRLRFIGFDALGLRLGLVSLRTAAAVQVLLCVCVCVCPVGRCETLAQEVRPVGQRGGAAQKTTCVWLHRYRAERVPGLPFCLPLRGVCGQPTAAAIACDTSTALRKAEKHRCFATRVYVW